MTAASPAAAPVDRPAVARATRVALIADYREEGWPSMDLFAEMLASGLTGEHAPVRAELLWPAMTRRFSAPGAASGRGFTLDRLLARFVDYPRLLRRRRRDFDLFHIVDHSYAHLALALPAGRVVVTCHDIDAFRSVLQPRSAPRSLAFRVMTGRLIAGMRRAARVLCVSEATREAIVAHDLLAPARVEVVYPGVHPSCTPDAHPAAEHAAAGLLGPVRDGAPEVLHVGSTIARKRIDVLLHAFAAIRRDRVEARLIRVGGALTSEQRLLAERLGVASSIVTLPFLTRDVLAAVYRRAALVLQTSDAEGFGLPVAEAMACGTAVVASDLAVLREIGAEAAEYVPTGDSDAFARATLALLAERDAADVAWMRRRERGLARAAHFTWQAHNVRVLAAYARTLADLDVVTRGDRA